MKKNIILFAIIALFFAACNQKAEDAYEIKGNVVGLENQMIYLKHIVDDNMEIKDSVKSSNGTFSFEGTVDVPQQYVVTFTELKKEFPFFVESTEINIKGDVDSLQNLRFEGSPTQDLFDEYNEGINDLIMQQRELYQQYQVAKNTNDEAAIGNIEREYEKVDSLRMVYNDNFVKENPQSVAAAFIAFSNSYSYDEKKLDEVVNSFDTTIHKSVYFTKMKERLAKLKNTAIGKVAPDFVMKDVDDKNVSLKDFRGQYVLVDFWASWCSPCRQENPNVVKAYNDFKDKDFTILGVSLDQDRDKWLEAIEKDELTWTHVSDLKGWKNKASNLYGVMSIPQNYLLDKNGVIIAKNLRAEELHEKLAEVLK